MSEQNIRPGLDYTRQGENNVPNHSPWQHSLQNAGPVDPYRQHSVPNPYNSPEQQILRTLREVLARLDRIEKQLAEK